MTRILTFMVLVLAMLILSCDYVSLDLEESCTVTDKIIHDGETAGMRYGYDPFKGDWGWHYDMGTADAFELALSCPSGGRAVKVNELTFRTVHLGQTYERRWRILVHQNDPRLTAEEAEAEGK